MATPALHPGRTRNFHHDRGRYRARLSKAGIPEDRIDAFCRHANQLPNLQLLEGAANIEKQATLPAAWLAKHFSDETARKHYREKHLLGEIPDELIGFEDFHKARRDLLRAKLTQMLSTAPTVAAVAASTS